MDIESRRRHIALMRKIRGGTRLLAVLYIAMTGFDAFRLHLLGLAALMAVLALGLVILATIHTRLIRQHRAALRRPDWAEIARMEGEIWGRTFDHGR